MGMMLLPLLSEMRKNRASAVSMTTASCVRPFSVIQTTLSSVL